MIGLTVMGGVELAAAFRRVAQSTQRPARLRALQAAAEPMRADMAAKAPRGDEAPHIADNIVVSVVRKVQGVPLHEDADAVAIGPAKDFFYGFFLEYGWKFHPGSRPFVRPAFDGGQERAMADIGASLWDEIAEAAGT